MKLKVLYLHTYYVANSSKKILQTHYPSRFFLQFSRIKVDLLSYNSKTTHQWEHYNWMAKHNWTPEFCPILLSWCFTQMQACLLGKRREEENKQQVILHPSRFFPPSVVAMPLYFSRFAVVRHQINSNTTESQNCFRRVVSSEARFLDILGTS